MTPAPVGHHCPTCVAEGRQSTRRLRPVLPRPRSATTAILAINVGVFAIDLILRATGQVTLLERGAMVPVLVAQGEWYRLVTAMFLHIGVLHLAFNSFALYLFGSMVEQALGTLRFVAVYLITGFAASAASFALSQPLTAAAGASGAVFGLLGVWLAVNLVIGFAVPGIDNVAHIGGLVAGMVAGFVIEGIGRRQERTVTSVAGMALLLVAAVALTAWRAAALTG